MKSKKNPARSWKLYCIIDSKVIKKKDPARVARALFKNRIRVIQLRYKNCPTYKLVRIAKKIRRLADKYSGILLINDRVDATLASGSDGAHLGSGDMPFATTRFLLGPKATIGKTVHSIKDAKNLQHENVDYISAGPVFSTPLKKNLKKQGLNFIKKIKKHATVPVFAIGGINPKNKEAVMSSGVDGVCVTRAIFQFTPPRPGRRASRTRRRLEAV